MNLGKVALWGLSVFFIFFGLIALFSTPPAALMALLIGIVLLPPMVGYINFYSSCDRYLTRNLKRLRVWGFTGWGRECNT